MIITDESVVCGFYLANYKHSNVRVENKSFSKDETRTGDILRYHFNEEIHSLRRVIFDFPTPGLLVDGKVGLYLYCIELITATMTSSKCFLHEIIASQAAMIVGGHSPLPYYVRY